jgi:hypothetical protein
MFPLYGSSSGFTYDNLREIRLDPLWTVLASTVTVAFLVLVALTASRQPPVQADDPTATLAYVAPVGAEHADDVIEAP